MATVDHSRSEAGRALNTLRDLNINAEGLLTELSPKSTEEHEMIQSTRRELQEGEDKYFALLEEFDDANSQLIDKVTGKINRGHSVSMPPPPVPSFSGVKFVKHNELMPEIVEYGTSPVEFEIWASALTQWLDACYFGDITPSAFLISVINR